MPNADDSGVQRITVKPDENPPTARHPRTIIGYLHFRQNAPIPDQMTNNPRIQVGHEFQNPIPSGSAHQGQEKGKWTSKFDFPGVPTKKFVQKQEKRVGRGHTWVVQNVYMNNNKIMATYVGWNASAIYEENWETQFKSDNKDLFEAIECRDKFLQAISKDPKILPISRKIATTFMWNFMGNPDHCFWAFEDLTYFHSRIQRNYGLPEMFYICLRMDEVEPPKFQYSTFNLIHEDVFSAIENTIDIQPFGAPRRRRTQRDQVPCEKWYTCQCHLVYSEYYSPMGFHLVPNQQGLLNFSELLPHHTPVLIECSNACGCSAKCPRRQLQKGQTKRLVVFYENPFMGFGLRSAEVFEAGEFICEWVGVVRKKRDNEDGRFSNGFVSLKEQFVIDAREVGNLARFIQYVDTDPNAILIETHSRALETDPWIPRLSIYALKRIAIGDRITVAKKPRDVPEIRRIPEVAHVDLQDALRQPGSAKELGLGIEDNIIEEPDDDVIEIVEVAVNEGVAPEVIDVRNNGELEEVDEHEARIAERAVPEAHPRAVEPAVIVLEDLELENAGPAAPVIIAAGAAEPAVSAVLDDNARVAMVADQNDNERIADHNLEVDEGAQQENEAMEAAAAAEPEPDVIVVLDVIVLNDEEEERHDAGGPGEQQQEENANSDSEEDGVVQIELSDDEAEEPPVAPNVFEVVLNDIREAGRDGARNHAPGNNSGAEYHGEETSRPAGPNNHENTPHQIVRPPLAPNVFEVVLNDIREAERNQVVAALVNSNGLEPRNNLGEGPNRQVGPNIPQGYAPHQIVRPPIGQDVFDVILNDIREAGRNQAVAVPGSNNGSEPREGPSRPPVQAQGNVPHHIIRPEPLNPVTEPDAYSGRLHQRFVNWRPPLVNFGAINMGQCRHGLPQGPLGVPGLPNVLPNNMPHAVGNQAILPVPANSSLANNIERFRRFFHLVVLNAQDRILAQQANIVRRHQEYDQMAIPQEAVPAEELVIAQGGNINGGYEGDDELPDMGVANVPVVFGPAPREVYMDGEDAARLGTRGVVEDEGSLEAQNNVQDLHRGYADHLDDRNAPPTTPSGPEAYEERGESSDTEEAPQEAVDDSMGQGHKEDGRESPELVDWANDPLAAPSVPEAHEEPRESPEHVDALSALPTAPSVPEDHEEPRRASDTEEAREPPATENAPRDSLDASMYHVLYEDDREPPGLITDNSDAVNSARAPEAREDSRDGVEDPGTVEAGNNMIRGDAESIVPEDQDTVNIHQERMSNSDTTMAPEASKDPRASGVETDATEPPLHQLCLLTTHPIHIHQKAPCFIAPFPEHPCTNCHAHYLSDPTVYYWCSPEALQDGVYYSELDDRNPGPFESLAEHPMFDTRKWGVAEFLESVGEWDEEKEEEYQGASTSREDLDNDQIPTRKRLFGPGTSTNTPFSIRSISFSPLAKRPRLS